MELLNAVQRFQDPSPAGRAVRQEALEIAVLVLAPIIPHVCHALWGALGKPGALIDEHWPAPDPGALAQDSHEIVVQVNGKLRAHITVPASADDDSLRAAAVADPHVQKFIGEAQVRKVIVVRGKLVNVVV